MTNKLLTWFQEDKKLITLIILTTIAFRIPTLFIEIFNADEPYYATAAMSILQGGIPYVDFVSIKPPLIFYIYALIFKIFGPDIRYVHLVVILVVFGTSYFLYKSLKLYSLKKAGLLAALFYSLFSTAFSGNKMWGANPEVFMNLPMALSVYFFLKGHIKNSFLSYFLSGFFVMIGVLIKQQASILYPLFFITIIYFSRKENWIQILKNLLIQGFVILIGSLVPLTFTLLLFALSGHLRELYIWHIQSNIEYYTVSHPPSLITLEKGVDKIHKFIEPTLILWVLGIYAYIKTKKLSTCPKNIYFIFVFWLFLTISAVIIKGGEEHDYLIFYSALAILGGLGATYFLSQLPHQHSNKIRLLFLAGIILPPLYFQVNGIARYFTGSFIAARPAIKEILNTIENELPNPEDRIFVWGRFPHFYYYTKHLPATRFITHDFLVPHWIYRYKKYKAFNLNDLPLEVKNNYKNNMEILISDLNKYKPRLIIDVQGSIYLTYWTLYKLEFFAELHQFIKQYYYPYKNIAGIMIYKRY